MDDARFDNIARNLARASSRRVVLRVASRALIGGVAASFVGLRGVAASRRAVGDICRKDGDCATGVCGPSDRTGRRRCACTADADCPSPGVGCLTTICSDGVCQERCANPYGIDACDIAIHECSAAGQGTCPDGCFTMQATNGFCGCIGSYSPAAHYNCVSDIDCVGAATCDHERCAGDRTVSCDNDSDCAQFATCINGACGDQVCTTDAECVSILGVPSLCMEGPIRPCSNGGANECWPMCSNRR